MYGAASGCGAVQVNYGQGEPTTNAIDGLPVSNYFTWTTGGQKTITATGQGNCSGSAETKITVNAPPSVSLTAPSNNDTFYAPATVNMTATASDSDGSVASVKFYAGSTLLSTDTSSPYSYSWSGMSNGNYSITAVATDNQGATTTSSAASITIADPAASTVTGVSVSQSSVSVNTSVTITVTGGNPCGAVQINFNDGNSPYLPIENLPYQTTHSWSSAGTYTITATGQGNCSGQASTQITVTSEGAASGPSGPTGPTGPTGPSSRPEPNATFGMAPPLSAPVTVTLDIAAGANGTVTSSPSGFNCTGNDTTCTAEFEATTTVTLTATPGSGNAFLGWGGACAGTGTTCEVAAAAGQLVLASFGAGSAATMTYYHTDALGSVRAISDGSGDTITRHDYFAFGESASPPIGDLRRFTGAPRDAETGLDYFEARYFRGVWGRMTSADNSIYSDVENPQTFNLYAYVMNNPLRWVDPTGHQADLPCTGGQCGTMQVTVNVSAWGCLAFCGIDQAAFTAEGLAWFLQRPRTIAGIRLREDPREQSSGLLDFLYELTVAPYVRVWNGTASEWDYAGIIPFGKVFSVPGKIVFRFGPKSAAEKLRLSLASNEGMSQILAGGYEVIAHSGEVRDAARLISQYGGASADWVKVSSTAEGRLQTHAYVNLSTGQVVEMKSKIR